ncbi:hypothetical protein KP509_18G080700 [Ceratopteris richardii]|nr:hypothetical protein KP509_18G080700 [Ceratopteris richardii]
MYMKCSAFDKAWEVLYGISDRDVVSWSALISGYAQKGFGHEALDSYEQMRTDGLSPNAFTYACLLKACSITQNVDMGKQIHEEIASQKLLEEDVILGNALVDMYAKFGALTKARQVFDELSCRDTVSWSTLIAGYIHNGKNREAVDFYEQMVSDRTLPDALTYTCILKACAAIGAVDRGKQLHDEIVARRILGKNVILGTALVDMYAKFGMLNRAQEVLNELSVRSVASWNALISGYVQQGLGKEALDAFNKMRNEGLTPTIITYTSVLKACGIMKEVEAGKQVHYEVFRLGYLGKDPRLSAALIDMYVKCGLLDKAEQMISDLPIKNVGCWNALLAGYAEQGQSNEAWDSYERMCREGLSEDTVTYGHLVESCRSIDAANWS